MTTPYDDPSFSYASPYKPEERKPATWETVLTWVKMVLAWEGIILAGILILGSPLQSDKASIAAAILVGFAVLLPSGWYLLHRRREKHGAEPMKKHWGLVWAVAAVLLFAGFVFTPKTPLVPAPATGQTSTPVTTETTTAPESAPWSKSMEPSSSLAPEPQPSTTETAPVEPSPVEETPLEQPEQPAEDERPYIEQPAEVAPEAPAPAENTGVYYTDCDQARAAGAAPLYAGMPGYRPGLDRNSDGVACEN